MKGDGNLKKIRITEKNIHTVNGLINRFFESIQKKNHRIGDSYLIKWKMLNNGTYTSRYGRSSVFYRNDNPFILITCPVKSALKIGDYVVIDGNRFMYRKKNNKWGRIYFRKLPEYEVAR